MLLSERALSSRLRTVYRYYGCPKKPVITQAGMRAALVVNVEHSWLNNDERPCDLGSSRLRAAF